MKDNKIIDLEKNSKKENENQSNILFKIEKNNSIEKRINRKKKSFWKQILLKEAKSIIFWNRIRRKILFLYVIKKQFFNLVGFFLILSALIDNNKFKFSRNILISSELF